MQAARLRCCLSLSPPVGPLAGGRYGPNAVVGAGVAAFGAAGIDGGGAIGAEDDGIAARQAAAFGQPFVDMLRSLRIGVVGASGTGSSVLTLLARAGIGELVIIDNDKVANSDDLFRVLDKHQIGETVQVHIYRDGRRMTVPVRLMESNTQR